MRRLLQLALVLTSALTISACCCPDGQVVDVTPAPPPPKVVAVEPPPAPAKRDLESRLPVDERILLALSKKHVKGLDWEEVDLDAAVTYLRVITGHKFHISEKVREEKFDDVVISAQLDDVSVKTILDVVLTEPFEMRWEVRKGVIWIITSEELGGALKLRYFDLKDLAVNIQDFTGKRVGAVPVEAPGSKNEDAELVELIRKEVHPAYWDRDDVAIEARNGILIVRASKVVHDAIDRFLSAERRRRGVKDPGNALRAKFEKTKVSLSVKSETLGGVIRMLQITTGFNLMIDSRSVADVESNPIAGLQLKDTPLTTALTMLAASAGDQYVWVYERNMAVLTHKEHVR